DFIESLLKAVSLRQGFGDVLARGLLEAADCVGAASREQIIGFLSKAGQPVVVDPRLYVTSEMLHATEPKPPQPQLREPSVLVTRWVGTLKNGEPPYMSGDVVRRIAMRFWGSEIAADFSTHEGKALAAKMIQDRQYAKDCLILCSFLWPVMDTALSADHAGDPTLESQALSAVTGVDVDEERLRRLGERVFNLQRAVVAREGHLGREEDVLPEVWHTQPLKGDPTNPDCLVPGKDGVALTRRGAVVDRGEFERTRDEYYRLRNWDPDSGCQTRAGLDDLGLGDVAADLGQRGLLRP
ncbi:MAG: hypothetical protein NTU41_08020, partial [Chloroflexi bacterium]|nr:hypothetical protein [Chloroflexota bacterium]